MAGWRTPDEVPMAAEVADLLEVALVRDLGT